jgi:hypothetical protein
MPEDGCSNINADDANGFVYIGQRGRKIETAGAGVRPHEVPLGIGSVQTFSGRHTTIGDDRIEMSEEDANCLIPYGWILITE